MLTKPQNQQIRQLLLKRHDELQQSHGQRQDAAKPVVLDQQSVGRLSRMDAIQQQQMALANRGQAEAELKAIAAALVLMDQGDYGYCELCDEPIGWQRLLARPTAQLCIVCQQKAES